MQRIIQIIFLVGVFVCGAYSSSYVRFLHACSFLTGTQSLKANGTILISDIGISKLSDYEVVPPGLVRLSVESEKGEHISSQVNLNSGSHYTVAIMGEHQISMSVMVDTIWAEEEWSLVRVVPLVSLNVDLKLYFNFELFSKIKSNEQLSLSTSYKKTNEGNYSVSLMNMKGEALCMKAMKLSKGKAYTIYIVPSKFSNTLVHLLSAEDMTKESEQSVHIRLFHASVQLIPAIDLVVNGRVVVGGVRYGKTSIYTTINMAMAEVKVKLSGSSKMLVNLKELPFLAGNYYTLAIFGEDDVNWKLLVDAVLPSQSCSLYRIVHLSQSLETHQVVSAFNRPLLSMLPNPLKFTDVTNFVTTCSSSVQVSISSATQFSTFTTSILFRPSLGRTSSLFIIGSTKSNSRPVKIISIDNPTQHINIEEESAMKAHLGMDLHGFAFIV